MDFLNGGVFVSLPFGVLILRLHCALLNVIRTTVGCAGVASGAPLGVAHDLQDTGWIYRAVVLVRCERASSFIGASADVEAIQGRSGQ